MALSTEPEPFVPPDTYLSGFGWLPLNIEHLLASELVAIGTPEECWAALLLWCHAWRQVPAGSLPNDERRLAALSGAGKRWPRVREIALHGFVLCGDGRLYHRYLCAEVLRTCVKRDAYRARREADRKRLEAWRSKRDETDVKRVSTRARNGTEMRNTYTKTKTVTVRKEPDGSSLPDDVPKDADASFSLTADAMSMNTFDEWWRAYPRKVGKGRARRCYAAARKAGVTAEELLAGAVRYAGAAIDAEPQFVAHPATWLHQGRWQDENVGITPRQRSPAEGLWEAAWRVANEADEQQSRANGADRSPAHPLLGGQ
jgi:hypothetical protein